MNGDRDAFRRSDRRRLLGAGLVLCLVVGGCLWAWASGALSLGRVQALVAASRGPWLIPAYLAAVVLMETVWLPRLWGLLMAGVLFGPLAGALLSMVADNLGALVSYGIARGAAGQAAQRGLAQRPRLADAVDILTRRRGVLIVALLRICPLVHYTAVSFAAGLTGISLRSFALGTALGVVPGALVYPLLGDALIHLRGATIALALALIALMLYVSWRALPRDLLQPRDR